MTLRSSKTGDELTKLIAWVRSYSGKSLSEEHSVARPSRYWSDAYAAWQKWHSVQIAPELPASRNSWYVSLECARVETLAGAELDGVRSNLMVCEKAGNTALTPESLYILARRVFAGRDESVSGSVLQPFSFWGRLCRLAGLKGVQPRGPWIKQQLNEARSYLADQESFQTIICNLINMLPNWGSAENLDEVFSFSTVKSAESLVPDVSEKDSDLEGDGEAVPGADELGSAPDAFIQSYTVFSRKLDEVGTAQKWLCSEDSALLELLSSPDRQRVQHIARKLQRRLLARACPRWEFDCTEGILDSRKLSRLITAHGDVRVFRQEVEREEDQAFVCFLVDISGSMRRERRVMAALTLDMILHTLDQCTISAEALAFTTRYFYPNPLVEEWRFRGSPPSPGRLNAARHIVLKDGKQRWKSARKSLALLLKDGFGCENLDGEALDWAARRLAIRPERRKMLVVLSDGEPYDEATERANGALYLENHLRQVIKAIDDSGISLAAIGFGSQVGRFYRHSLSVASVDDLPRVVFDRVGDLLLSTSDSTQRR